MLIMSNSSMIFRAGFVAVMGRPNVGKSTLVNALIGHKVAAVSPRPQTTRKRQMGILTIQDDTKAVQVIFIDTPGVHQPRHKLGDYMNDEAWRSHEESDLLLLLVDASVQPTEEDLLLFTGISKIKHQVQSILCMNKIDLVEHEIFLNNQAAYQENIPAAIVIPISATRGDNLDRLLTKMVSYLPEGMPYFPLDQLTDLYERDIAADLIREAALNILRDEIPHGIAVRIDQYTERGEQGALIEATILVEKESHKPIVIGAQGNMAKKIGVSARREIEAVTGRKVYLSLKVKVRKNWRDDESFLKRFGY